MEEEQDKAIPNPERETSGSLRRRAEELVRSGRVQRLIDDDVAKLSVGELATVVHELRVHQEELTLQNEDLRHAHEELAESRDRYRFLYDDAPVGFLTLDQDGRVLEANRTLATLLGTEQGSLVGSPITGFIAPGSQDEFFLHRNAACSDSGKATCEVMLRTVDGTGIHARLESRSAPAPHGEESRVLRTAVIDLTQEKVAEEWRILARRMERMVEELPAAAVFVDHDEIHLNRAAEVLTGYGRDELSNLDDWFDRVHGSEAQAARTKYAELREGGFHDRSETTSIWRRDGEERFVEIAYHRFDDQQVWLLYDLTERMRAEGDQTRLAALVHASPLAIVEAAVSGTIQYWNPAAERLFGYTSREVVGKSIEILAPPGRRDEAAALMEVVRADGVAPEFETERRHKDGTMIEVAITIAAVRESAGALASTMSIIRDIRVRKRLERDVAAVVENEQQRIAMELHDGLGSMLTAIDWRLTAFSRSLEKNALEEEGEEALAISREVRDSISLVRTVTQGLQPLGDDPREFVHALRGLAEQVRASGLAKCRLRLPGPGTRPLSIRGSGTAQQLLLIAREAANNAQRHSGATHLAIVLGLAGEKLVLSVSDNGCGFDPENRPDRTEGGEGGPVPVGVGSDARNGRGLGIGTMRYRAKLIGARLRILPRRGGGTRVVCEL